MSVVLITFDESHKSLKPPLFFVSMTFVLIIFHELSKSIHSALVSSQVGLLFQTEMSPAYVKLKSGLVFKCDSTDIALLPSETLY